MILDIITSIVLWTCVFGLLDRFGYNQTDRFAIAITIATIFALLGWGDLL